MTAPPFERVGGNGRPQIAGITVYRRERPVDAQASPGAASDTDLVTVAAGYEMEGRVWVANRGAATTIRIAARMDAAALGNEHYLSYDEPLAANESLHTEVLDLPSGAIVTVRSASGSVSFSFIGKQREGDVNF